MRVEPPLAFNRSSVSSREASCPSDNRIAAFLSGDVDVVSQIEEHLAGCRACRELVGVRAESLAAADSSLESSRMPDPPLENFRPRPDEALGRYELRGELARGGMGRILEGWDRRHGRPVAIKVSLHRNVQLGRELGFFSRDEEMAEAERSAQRVLAPLDQEDSRTADLVAKALQLESGALQSLGRSAEVVETGRRSIAIREKLVARDPANADWQMRLAYALSNVAHALQDLGRVPEAIATARRQAAVAEMLVEHSPADEEVRGGLGQTLGQGLAPLLVEGGQGDEAKRLFQRARTLLDPLVSRHETLRWRWSLAGVLSSEADLELGRGHLDEAFSLALRADDVASKLPISSHDELLLAAARARGLLGRVQVARGDTAAARASLEAARTQLDDYWGHDKERAQWARSGGPETHAALAALLTREGSRDEARACLDAAIRALESLGQAGLLSARARTQLAMLHAKRERVEK